MLSNEELLNIKGGALSITGALINNVVQFYNKIFEFGQSLGSTIRRLSENKLCKI